MADDKGNDGKGDSGGGDKGGSADLTTLLSEMKAMREQLQALSPKGGQKDDDDLLDKIQKDKKSKEDAKAMETKLVEATKFNLRLDTFLKEYAGILPSDANEIPKAATLEKYSNEVERSAAIKATLMQSFFKEEENLKYLSESQLAKWKAYQSLGTVGRTEEAPAIYDVVFEPAVNHARSIRQAQIKASEGAAAGSKDSDIIFRKLHEKQLRSISGTHKLNDVLYEQAKGLGLVKTQA